MEPTSRSCRECVEILLHSRGSSPLTHSLLLSGFIWRLAYGKWSRGCLGKTPGSRARGLRDWVEGAGPVAAAVG